MYKNEKKIPGCHLILFIVDKRRVERAIQEKNNISTEIFSKEKSPK